jgi:hypothetical protein
MSRCKVQRSATPAIAIVSPEPRFERVVEAAASVVESLRFSTA